MEAEIIGQVEKKSSDLERVVSQIEIGCVTKRLADRYYSPKSFERWNNGKLYAFLGVRSFKKFIPTSGDYTSRLLGWHPIRDEKNKEKALQDYDLFSRILEGVHVGSFAFFTSLIIYTFGNGDLESASWQTALNLTVNVYPIMVQRYNRARIYNLLERKQNKPYGQITQKSS